MTPLPRAPLSPPSFHLHSPPHGSTSPDGPWPAACKSPRKTGQPDGRTRESSRGRVSGSRARDGARGPGIATPQHRRPSFSSSSSSRGCLKHPLPLLCACVCVSLSVSGAVRPAEVRNLPAVLVCLPSGCVCLVVPCDRSERHVAAVGRLSFVRRSRVAWLGVLVGSAACLRACVRCRAHVSCAARPLTSGCIVTCVWSRVYDVRVRGGARSPPHMRLIRY